MAATAWSLSKRHSAAMIVVATIATTMSLGACSNTASPSSPDGTIPTKPTQAASIGPQPPVLKSADGLPLGGAPHVTAQAPISSMGLSMAAANAFGVWESMKQTRYQHKFYEDVAAGTYFFDCVGWTTYLLSHAAPRATASLRSGTGVTNRHLVPTPLKYEQFLLSLSSKPAAGWAAVQRAADVTAGDILAWQPEANNPGRVGHAVVAIGPATKQPDGSYALAVVDSTATPHGPDDTRRTDPRNLPITPGGRPSGLGIGTIGITVDSAGAATGIIWSLGTTAVSKRIGLGRPTG